MKSSKEKRIEAIDFELNKLSHPERKLVTLEELEVAVGSIRNLFRKDSKMYTHCTGVVEDFATSTIVPKQKLVDILLDIRNLVS